MTRFGTFKRRSSIQKTMLGAFQLLVLLPATIIIACSLLTGLRNALAEGFKAKAITALVDKYCRSEEDDH